MNSGIQKLVLGTVQLGRPYGINVESVQPSVSEAERILMIAQQAGIKTLDTSADYGMSEDIIGNSGVAAMNMHIISKCSCPKGEVKSEFYNSLRLLKRKKIYGYLIHYFRDYRNNPEIWNELQDLKSAGLVDKIGFSLYTVDELDYLLSHKISFDIIQIPYNILNKDFEVYFSGLKMRNIEIYARSVFIQGILMYDENMLPSKLLPLYPIIQKLKMISESNNMKVKDMALSFVLSNPYIDGVIIGVKSEAQLWENIGIAQKCIDLDFQKLFEKIYVQEKFRYLLNPSNW